MGKIGQNLHTLDVLDRIFEWDWERDESEEPSSQDVLCFICSFALHYQAAPLELEAMLEAFGELEAEHPPIARDQIADLRRTIAFRTGDEANYPHGLMKTCLRPEHDDPFTPKLEQADLNEIPAQLNELRAGYPPQSEERQALDAVLQAIVYCLSPEVVSGFRRYLVDL